MLDNFIVEDTDVVPHVNFELGQRNMWESRSLNEALIVLENFIQEITNDVPKTRIVRNTIIIFRRPEDIECFALYLVICRGGYATNTSARYICPPNGDGTNVNQSLPFFV